jgi:UDP-N-acetyl-D-glucosamine dehydrogenase
MALAKIPSMSTPRTQTLAIIGQGYVGLPLAMAAVDAGWNVVGVDVIEAKVGEINLGLSPVEDVSNSQLKSAIESGAYFATTDFSSVSKASVITICVPTPLDDKREPDLSLLRSAATAIAPHVISETLVVSESTSYPGTLREVIIPIINGLKPHGATGISFASAPERVNPGDPVWNQRNTPRLVGAIDEASQEKALTFYNSICDSVISVSTPEVAEASKLLENTFRLVNIALVNEFTQLCSSSGISVHEVIDAAATKPYGFFKFTPGVGVGGHCIPVDPLYLTWWGRQKNSPASIVEISDSINNKMPQYVAKCALKLIEPAAEKPKVLILGVAYKPGVADVRETPASELRRKLIELGAEVAWHDPLVEYWENTKCVSNDWDCDIAIVVTMQPGIQIDSLLGKGSKILDCTNTFRGKNGVNFL